MARYIDADKIRDEVFDCLCLNWNIAHKYNMYSDVLDMIDNTPTKDVIPVVRCKDCRNCKKSLFTLSEEYICLYTQKTTTPEDYCSVAIKRDEDE